MRINLRRYFLKPWEFLDLERIREEFFNLIYNKPPIKKNHWRTTFNLGSLEI